MSYCFFIMTTTTMMLIKVHASISHFTAFPFVNNFCCLFFYFSRTLFHWLKIAALLSQVMTQKRLFWLKWNVWLRIWSKNCLWTATWYKKSHRYVTKKDSKITNCTPLRQLGKVSRNNNIFNQICLIFGFMFKILSTRYIQL